MIVECPHCYRKVLTNDDGTCPACKKNINALAGTDQSKTLVTLSSRQKLPAICIHCGRAAVTEQTFVRKERNREMETSPTFILGILEGMLMLLVGRFLSDDKQVIRLDLPVCEQHLNEKPPLKHLDFENYRASFVVDKKFRKILHSERSS